MEAFWEGLWKVLTFAAGFVAGVFTEPLRQWIFKPTLLVAFAPDERHISETEERVPGKASNVARYVRMEVANTRRFVARNCKAFLVNVEKQGPSGEFQPTKYCDSIPLAWSCRGDEDRFCGLDIHKGVFQYIDVFATREGSCVIDPQILVKPFRYASLFEEKATFRFTIQVSAENADPKRIRLIVTWRGIWDDFEAYKDSGYS